MHIIFGGAPISLQMWIFIIAVSLFVFIIIELEKWIRKLPLHPF
ncbi:MAG: hypothetical protein GYA71_02375 [Bacteroidales bacterium]|nr:hypothetical protein [Bacteroidales bacterium]